MATKTQRIEMRTDPDNEARITQAANLVGTSVSVFVLEAAAAAADRVLARSSHTVMTAEEFDTMIASLDVADPAPTLHRVARRPRRFSRHA